MEKPSATVGVVENETLSYEQYGGQVTAIVGTPSWYAWLEVGTTFTFDCEEGTFTAHKARAGNRRGGWYWRAYRFQHGRIFRCYLGVSANLTLPYLREVAHRLAARAEGTANRKEAQGVGHGSRITISSDVLAPSLLVATKCALPRLPVQHIPRAHLVALLERGAAGPLTLVSAPAGSGKTTLLTEWARTTQMPVAWLSLETADSDPACFLAYLLAALHTLDERIGREARELLDTRSAPDLENALSSLVNDLAYYLAADAALVLDDYHVLEIEATHALLLFLLEHQPGRFHLVLGTRVDPPLPLARLRTRGQVSEIRAGALRFATVEMQFFLHQMDVDLGEEALSSLEERTEGWIAGVQLAALALRGRGDHETFLREFRGTHRFLLEYIGEEILARLTPQVRAFLLQTSILEQLSGSLCDAVTASTGGQAMLEELRKANLFVSALDDSGEWYRYHALFAEGLRHQLLQQEPELFSELCARASAWYEAQEMLFEACEYALQARDYAHAVPLIERQVGKLIGRIQFPLLQRWLEQLPPEIITSRPLLGVASTWALLVEDDHSGQLSQMVVQLQQRFQEHPAATDEEGWVEARANLNFMRVLQAMGNNDAGSALEVARQTLQALPEDATSLRRLASVCLGLAQGTAHRVSGDYAAAERVLIEAGMQTQATNYHFLNLAAMSVLAEIYEAQGELHKLEGLYQRLLQMARAYREAPPELVLWIYLGYAKLFLDWNRLDEAEDSIQLALAAYQRTQIKELTLACRFVQLWISQARGRDEETRELLQKMEKDLSSIPLTQPVVRFEALWRVRLRLRQGNVDEAGRWLRASGLSYDDPFTTLPDNDFFFAKYATLARILIAQGRRYPKEAHLMQALALLERFCPFYEKAGFKGRVAEILVLTSLALQARGETRPALVTLGRAVSLAEPTGVVRLFADEGEVMARLLAQVSAYTTASPTYLHTLQTSISSIRHVVPESVQAAPRQLLIDPLSPREREVLSLLVEGLSNQQIADRLVISLNTAKRHVKHILAKLTATNRTQAVARARDLHLL
jgi:ATP/maltotriose-dependent transcriptional regulator MalT